MSFLFAGVILENTSTVETLIQQNKTLACKVVAHSKKVNSLYEVNEAVKKLSEDLRKENEALKAENAMQKEEVSKLTKCVNDLTFRLSEAEKNYVIISSDYKAKCKEFNRQEFLFSKKLRLFERFFQRVKKWVKPQVARFKIRNKELEGKIKLDSTKIVDLKTNIESMSKYITDLSKQKDKELLDLESGLNDKYDELKLQNDKLKKEKEELTVQIEKKDLRLSSNAEQITVLKNNLIRLYRS